MMSLKKSNQRLENLRRSSRTEILRLRAEAQKDILKPVVEVILKDEKKSPLVRRKKSSKKKKKSKQNDQVQFPFTTTFGTDGGDGFIPDEPVVEKVTSNHPMQFNELEVWKQYQTFGDNDDGFILDDEPTVQSSPHNPEPAKKLQQKEIPKPVRVKKRLSDIWKKDRSGKKLSKKKRRKAERKWLKKLFHESVIIAEPLESEPSEQINVPFVGQSIPSMTMEIPVEIAGETLLPIEGENGSSGDQTTNDPEMLNSSEMIFTGPTVSYEKTDAQIISKAKHDSHEYSSYLQTNGNPPVLSPWRHQDGNMHVVNEMEGVGNLPHNNSLQEQTEGKSPLDDQEELEKLRLSGGFSKSEFIQHLLKLHKKYSLDRLSLDDTQVKTNTNSNVMTNFVDLTSGKTETDDKKKRYKMELSLPEKTTILVTNMVTRESSLPKVIFMLKKGPTKEGAQQESPLLMGCSGDSNKHGIENDSILIKEVQEITQHILRMQSGGISPIKSNKHSVAIHQALEYSMK